MPDSSEWISPVDEPAPIQSQSEPQHDVEGEQEHAGTDDATRQREAPYIDGGGHAATAGAAGATAGAEQDTQPRDQATTPHDREESEQPMHDAGSDQQETHEQEM